MKKYFLTAIIAIGFTITSQAQVAKTASSQSEVAAVTIQDKAQKNVDDLRAFTSITDETASMMYKLFNTKIRMYKNAGDSEENKNHVRRSISMKLNSTLDYETFEKLKANTALFNSLIN